MARTPQLRSIQVPPRLKGFMPIGNLSSNTEVVEIAIEEYEAIRLLDYEGLSQVEAAAIMQVSRPTLTRIYGTARSKIARAFTEVLPIGIVGGRVSLQGNWLLCDSCRSRFNYYHAKPEVCPVCDCAKLCTLNP